MLHSKLGHSPVEVVTDEALVRSVIRDREVEVRGAGAEPLGTGLLRHSSGALTLSLAEPRLTPGLGEPVELRFEEGRSVWSLATRVVAYEEDGSWSVEWPEMVRRRDRRRFVRQHDPQHYAIRTAEGEPLVLEDLSVNGAAFALHSNHQVRVGDHLHLEVSFEGGGPTTVSFEVLRVSHDSHRQTWSMRGRFLEYAEPGDPLDDEIRAILDHLGTLLSNPTPPPPRERTRSES